LTASEVEDLWCNGEIEEQFCMNTWDSTTWCTASAWQTGSEIQWTDLPVWTNYFFVRARDGLGNMSVWSTWVAYQRDIYGPQWTIYGRCTNLKDIPRVLQAQDMWCSTVENMRFSCDGEHWSDWEVYTGKKTIDLAQSTQIWCTTRDDEVIMYVQYMDEFWNIGNTQSGTTYCVNMFVEDLSCISWWEEIVVTWVSTTSLNLSDIVVQRWTLWSNFLYAENPMYSWTITTPDAWYGKTVVSIYPNPLEHIYVNNVSGVVIKKFTVDEIETLTICNPVDSGECITMMDRNLWATTNDITSTWSYGNHYQWWNNYGFSQYITPTNSSSQINTSQYGPNNWYNSSIFRKLTSRPYDWSNPRNDNLWWWSWDDSSNGRWYPMLNPEERQWPCPDWYHVPSAWEWNEVMSRWAAEYTWAWNSLILSVSNNFISFQSNPWASLAFRNSFYIPFAWYRNYNASVYNLGSYARLWTSSPDLTYSYNWSFSKYFSIGPTAASYNSIYRSEWYSLHCFKNTAIDIVSIESW